MGSHSSPSTFYCPTAILSIICCWAGGWVAVLSGGSLLVIEESACMAASPCWYFSCVRTVSRPYRASCSTTTVPFSASNSPRRVVEPTDASTNDDQHGGEEDKRDERCMRKEVQISELPWPADHDPSNTSTTAYNLRPKNPSKNEQQSHTEEDTTATREERMKKHKAKEKKTMHQRARGGVAAFPLEATPEKHWTYPWATSDNEGNPTPRQAQSKPLAFRPSLDTIFEQTKEI